MSTDFSASQGGSKTSSFDPEHLRAGQRLAGVFTLKKVLPTATGESPIWIAEDDVAEREVSLHFIPSAVGTDPDVCEAIRTEVRRGRQFIHPSILRVHDLADEPEWSAVVMDSFEGQSLAKLLEEKRRGYFESEEVLPWLDSILQILADAHSIGLFHRDLNLHDLILTSDDRIVLANFGVSRVVTDAMRRRGALEDGALAYTSPQLLGYASPTASDDIYSVGACLYELLTGRPVFEGPGIEGKIRSERPLVVMEARQKLGRTGDLLYPNWEKIISQCLSKEVSERPASILKIQQKLGFKTETPEPKVGPAVPEPPAMGPTEKAPAPKPATEKSVSDSAPVHMGVADEGVEEVSLDPSARETLNMGPRRPLLTSPLTPLEQERRDRNSLLLRILMLGALGTGVWFGGGALVRHFLAKPVVITPVQKPAPDPEKAKEVRFVAPAAPGTSPELTALRPGQPVKPRPVDADATSPDSLTPVPLDPPPGAPAEKKVDGAMGQKPVVPPVVEPVEPVVDPRIEAAQNTLEALLAQSLTAAKEYDKLKAKKDPNASQKAAIAAAKKAKEQAEKKVIDAQKALDDLTKEIAASEPKPAPAPEPAKVTDPKAAPNAIENSIGMLFLPVGDVQFSMYETRVKDYAIFVDETGYPKIKDLSSSKQKPAPEQDVNWRNPGFEQSPDHPVVMVSWNDANSFCKWLTDRERKLGILGASEYYRLPTDLEWSRAIGLPEETGKDPLVRDGFYSDRFPWGTLWPPPQGFGNFNGQETGSDISIKGYTDAFPWTAPVGSFSANELGLYDLSGNVWEWCMDTITPAQKERVLRGGCWQVSLQSALASSSRLYFKPERRSEVAGFRVVRAKDGGRFPR